MRPFLIALLGLAAWCCEGRAADQPSGEAPASPAGPAVSEWELPGGGRVRQQRIATLSEPSEILISDDLAHVAVIAERPDGKQRVVVDGKEGPEYDKAWFLKHAGPNFGSDGMPVLYAAAAGGRCRLVVNGRPGLECDAWLDVTPCGPDRSGIAYAAVGIMRKAFVATDGRAGPLYDDVSCPVLSPDRKRLAYIACKGFGPERRQIPVLDGKEGPECDEIAVPSSAVWNVFSPDSGHTAYVARLGPKWRVVLDGQPGAEYDQISADSLAFSPDSRRIAYAARSGSKWQVVADGRPGSEYDRVGVGPILFRSGAEGPCYTALTGAQWQVVCDGQPPVACDEVASFGLPAGQRHLICAVRQGAQWHAVVDGQAGPAYDEIGLPGGDRFWISSGDARVAYAARLGTKWHVVVDGQAGDACDEVRQNGWPAPFFSPDGKHTAYRARKGEAWSLVLDGQPGLSCDQIAAGSFEFSADGTRTAYAAKFGPKWRFVLDGRAGKEYDLVDASAPVFAPDGQRTAYLAKLGDKWRVVVNAEEGPEYGDVDQLVYSPDGRHLVYVASRGTEKEFLRTSRRSEQFVVLDGQPGPAHLRVGAGAHRCVPQGDHRTNDEWRVHSRAAAAKGKKGLIWDTAHYPVFSPDGKHLAYQAVDANPTRTTSVVLDGAPGPLCAPLGAPAFSPDSQHLAYAAALGDHEQRQVCLVLDGKLGPLYDQIELPAASSATCFSPDGKHTAYAARKGAKWCAVVDGKEGPECDTFFGAQSVTSYRRPAAFASWRSVTWSGKQRFQYALEYRSPDFQPVFFGADGRHVAYAALVETRARTAVVVDGQAGPSYDQVSMPVVSPDGRHVAYIACQIRGRERKYFAVIDGQESPAYDEIPLNDGRQWPWPVFGSDSRRTAYVARTGRKWCVVVDGQPGPEYDRIEPADSGAWDGFLSTGGLHVAYLAVRDGKWRAVIDGQEGPAFDRLGANLPMTFSPNGLRVAYMAQWGRGAEAKLRAVIDGEPGPEYDAGFAWGIAFSPDSRRTAYVGRRGNQAFVVLDGKELEPHDSVDGIRLCFSPDGERLSYIAYRGKNPDQKAHIVVDGKEGPEHGDYIWDHRFSPDSKHHCYVAINGRWQDQAHTEQMVVDGTPGPVVKQIERDFQNGPVWSSDCRHLAYAASQDKKKLVVIDGVAGAAYERVSEFEFSPDGKHSAYIAYKQWCSQHVVVRDGQPGAEFEGIEDPGKKGRLFSPDGLHVACKTKQAHKHAVAVDDEPGPPYDSVMGTWFHVGSDLYGPNPERSLTVPRRLPDGAVQYPAYNAGKPGELYIVTQWPPAGPPPAAPLPGHGD